MAVALVVVIVLAVGLALLVARLHGGKIPRFWRLPETPPLEGVDSPAAPIVRLHWRL